jgi:hypothetical protein
MGDGSAVSSPPVTADEAAPQVLRPIYAASAAAGFIVAPMPGGPFDSLDVWRALGRHVVALAKALESACDHVDELLLHK